MKSVLISIQPKWCELIASGKKTIEVRKTRPKIDTPFKVYVYETNWKNNTYWKTHHKDKLGKVIGEFVCDEINEVYQCHSGWIQENACLSRDEFFDYLGIERGTHFGYHKKAYAWHISDLVIYDEPKELSEFYKKDFEEVYSEWEDLFNIGVPSDCSVCYPPKPKKEDYIIKRPPQSWCYVEKVGDTE